VEDELWELGVGTEEFNWEDPVAGVFEGDAIEVANVFGAPEAVEPVGLDKLLATVCVGRVTSLVFWEEEEVWFAFGSLGGLELVVVVRGWSCLFLGPRFWALLSVRLSSDLPLAFRGFVVVCTFFFFFGATSVQLSGGLVLMVPLITLLTTAFKSLLYSAKIPASSSLVSCL
jgi:hypothetical protein